MHVLYKHYTAGQQGSIACPLAQAGLSLLAKLQGQLEPGTTIALAYVGQDQPQPLDQCCAATVDSTAGQVTLAIIGGTSAVVLVWALGELQAAVCVNTHQDGSQHTVANCGADDWTNVDGQWCKGFYSCSKCGQQAAEYHSYASIEMGTDHLIVLP